MFSINLKTLREQANLSQQELANVLNLSQSTIATWETTKKEPALIKRLKQIAKALNTSTDNLIGLEKEVHNLSTTNNEQQEIIEMILTLTQLQLIQVKSFIIGLTANLSQKEKKIKEY